MTVEMEVAIKTALANLRQAQVEAADAARRADAIYGEAAIARGAANAAHDKVRTAIRTLDALIAGKDSKP